MQSQALLSQELQDLSCMDKSEVSKNLFTQIQWEEILRSGIFLSHQDVSYHIIFLFFKCSNLKFDFFF